MRSTFVAGILVFTLLFAFSTVSSGQTYPNQPITYQIPFKEGGPSGMEAKRMLPYLKEKLNTDINLVYKAGAGGALAWAELVKQKPDGYFISGINIPHIILQPPARSGAGYETDQIKPVVFFNSTPTGVAVHQDAPFQTLQDLVAYAAENPNRLLSGGSGMWTGYHMLYLLFQEAAGVKMLYIPSKGDKPTTDAFLDGKTKVLWTNSSNLYQHRDQLKILAFASEEPFPLMPEVPTFRQAGYDIIVPVYRGIGVPPKTPEKVVSVLEKAFLDVVDTPDIQAEIKADGGVPISMNSEEAQEFIRQKREEWAPVVEKFK
jgi:tripartite-type tricarboxylate transporter receptor subunit TctC